MRKKPEKPVRRRHTHASRLQAEDVRDQQTAWMLWRDGIVRNQERWREWYDLEPGEWRFNFEAALEDLHERKQVPEGTYMYRPSKDDWPSFEDFVKGCYVDRCRTAPTPAARHRPDY